jgi:hypothetical protein
MVALSESDVRSALEVLRVAEAADGPEACAEAFPEPVLDALRRRPV